MDIPYMVLTIFLKYVINNLELTTILKQIRMEYAELDKRSRIVGFYSFGDDSKFRLCGVPDGSLGFKT